MSSRIWLQRIAMLLVASGLIGSLGCNSGSNNTMVGAAGAKSKTTTNESAETEPPGHQSEPILSDDAVSAELKPITLPVTDPADLPPITVQAADRAGLNELLASHKGKVVLVDYWASWCSPCRKKFPHTLDLAKAHKADGLTVISVAMDDDDAHEDVVKFLTEKQATILNLRSKLGGSEEAFESFEIPGGTLPCLRLFGRDGQVLKTFAIDENAAKQFTDDDVADAVKEALAQK